MKLSKEEITEELAHQNEMAQLLRRRRRDRERQAAQYGLDAPPHITNEINALTDQIRQREAEIARLETLFAEEQLSLAEAEYRTLLADAWGTPHGRPTVAGAARLELARLRLGLAPERAQELEHDVRVGLVQEVLTALDVRPLLGIASTLSIHGLSGMTVTINSTDTASISIDQLHISQELSLDDPVTSALRLIGRAIRLDAPTALRLLLVCLPPVPPIALAEFGPQLLTTNLVALYPDEFQLFDHFLTDLHTALITQAVLDEATSCESPSMPVLAIAAPPPPSAAAPALPPEQPIDPDA